MQHIPRNDLIRHKDATITDGTDGGGGGGNDAHGHGQVPDQEDNCDDLLATYEYGGKRERDGGGDHDDEDDDDDDDDDNVGDGKTSGEDAGFVDDEDMDDGAAGLVAAADGDDDTVPAGHHHWRMNTEHAADPGPLETEVAISCAGLEAILFLDPSCLPHDAGPNTRAADLVQLPRWHVRCLCPVCCGCLPDGGSGGSGSCPDGRVMGTSAFERHAGAANAKKWRSSCKVADPSSRYYGRPVLHWCVMVPADGR
jgi:hypothetical protein